jgi:signal transduction histidine kinase/CheY-like chemotaxis protein
MNLPVAACLAKGLHRFVYLTVAIVRMDQNSEKKPVSRTGGAGKGKAELKMSYSRRMEDAVEALLSISRKLNSSLDLSVLLDALVTESIRLVDAQGGCAGLMGPDGLVCHRYFKKGRAVEVDYCWQPMSGLPGWLMVHKVPYLTNNASQDPQVMRELCSRFDVRTAVGVPILSAQGELLGFFEIHNKQDPGGFTPEDEERLLAVAQQAAVAIQNARVFGRLQRTEEALKESDRRKDEFLATLAHELRNPLAPIRNGLELLKLAPKDDRVIAQTMPLMSRQLDHLVRLVDDLMDVSRISRGDIELRKEHLDLRSVLDSAVETVRPLLDLSGHELHVELIPPVIAVNADPVRLTQIFTNLLNNAIKYTPSGGHISIKAGIEGSTAMVEVKDTGIGMAPERLPHIFKMFRRTDQTTSHDQRGLGIGLSIVERLVRMHGGTITAVSEGIGMGSSFTVRLPAMLKSRNGGGPGSGNPNTTAHRILVVDDNPDAASTLALLFKAMGQDVRTASDGSSALDTAATYLPHLVIMDIGMPGMDGHEACRRIRNQSWGRGMRVVALTGWGRKEDRQRAMEAGFDDHFTKPVAITVLRELLAKVAHDRKTLT